MTDESKGVQRVKNSVSVEDSRPRKRVHFSSDLVTETKEAPIYNRTAVESDIFSCDVCGIQIPSGLKGFEPYGTCEACVDGFDACGTCCGTEAVMSLCRSTRFSATEEKPTLRVQCHEHVLKVVDRKAEVMWANDNNEEWGTMTPKKKKRQRSPKRSGSKSPRKKTKLE